MGIKYEDDIDNLVRIAQMYYYENMNQSDIAKKFRVSRPQISKLLMRAREMGIINITVQSPQNSIDKMQKTLIKYFSLTDCCIIPTMHTSFDEKQFLANTASEIIDRMVARASVIGLGWGDLIYTICEMATPQPHFVESSIVVPLIGSTAAPNRGYNTNELVRAFASSYYVTPKYLYAPAFPSGQLELNQFKQTDNYREINSFWDNMDVIILRISNYPCVPDLATSSRFGNALDKKKAVGAILSYFYDIKGNIIEGTDDYSTAAALDQIKRASTRFAIAAESTTVESLLGFLTGEYATHLIVAEETVKELFTLISL